MANETLRQMYIVINDGEVVFSSEELEPCRAYKEKIHKDDVRYIEDEYGLSEEESPLTVSYLSGRDGDASNVSIYHVTEADKDEYGMVTIDDTEFDFDVWFDECE